MTQQSLVGGASPWWRWTTYGVAAIVLTPICVIFLAWLLPVGDIWDHLGANVLPEVLVNSLVLLGGVLGGAAFIGVPLAWAVACLEFPGRRFLAWALLGPMAIPAYVLGFAYCGILDFSGPVQTFFRETMGIGWPLPSVRSAWGVIMVMSFALYPYVYFISLSAFSTVGARAIETGRSLGMDGRSGFFRLALPLARPWILSSLMLVAMECLADFGTVSIFVYDTFTTAIYKAWYGFFSPAAAAQLSSLLLVLVFALMSLQHLVDSRKRYTVMGSPKNVDQRRSLSRGRRLVVSVCAWTVFMFAFLVPLLQLGVWAGGIFAREWDRKMLQLIFNSMTLGGGTALLVLLASLAVAMGQRYFAGKGVGLAARISTLGYALPGTVLAVGIFLPLVWLDKKIVTAVESVTGWNMELIFTGTVFAMLLGLSIRFIAVGYAAVGNGTRRLSPRLDEAAASFGARGWRALIRVHLPLLRSSLLTGGVLVFVDVLKEMPLTLMTRPFGWDTLSVRIFELTSEGEWQRAALPSIVLLLTGLIPVGLLAKSMNDRG